MSKALIPKMSICKQGSTKFDKSRDDVWLKYIDIVDKNYSTNHQSLNIFLDNTKIRMKVSIKVIYMKQTTHTNEVKQERMYMKHIIKN